jgi:ribosome biogenesis GTPase A
MNKARNQLEDKMNLIDVVVEVLDARIPIASRNPMIAELVGDKPHLIVLNKADLADPVMTKLWQKALMGPKTSVMAMDGKHNTNMQALIHLIKRAGQDKVQKLQEKGAATPTIRICLGRGAKLRQVHHHQPPGWPQRGDYRRQARRY